MQELGIRLTERGTQEENEPDLVQAKVLLVVATNESKNEAGSLPQQTHHQRPGVDLLPLDGEEEMGAEGEQEGRGEESGGSEAGRELIVTVAGTGRDSTVLVRLHVDTLLLLAIVAVITSDELMGSGPEEILCGVGDRHAWCVIQ
jgi:hypothetical protein